MRLVADANILFSIVNPNTSSSQIIKLHNLKLFAPSFALGEIAKYRSEIESKSDLPFNKIKNFLQENVSFINESEFFPFFKQFKNFIDEKDISYLALASHLKMPIWSNDPHLKTQNLIRVFTTKDLVEALS